MTRLAVVATSARSEPRDVSGPSDSEALRQRLALSDAGFEVCELDPAVDLAEQIDALFDRTRPGASDAVLFYASSSVVVSSDGEFFLCLDDAHPETGDALADIAQVFVDRARGPLFFVLDCRHRADAADPAIASRVLVAAKNAVNPLKNGIGLLVTTRLETGGAEDVFSPFTRAFLGAMDGTREHDGLSTDDLYQRIQQKEARFVTLPSLAFTKAERRFELLASRRTTSRGGLETSAAAIDPLPASPAETSITNGPSQTIEMIENSRATIHGLSEAMMIPPPMSSVAQQETLSFREPTSEAPSFRAPVFEALQRDAISDSLRVAAISTGPSAPPSMSPPSSSPDRQVKRAPRTVMEHLMIADSLALAKDPEGALAQLKKALVLVGPSATRERAEIHLRIGEVKREQGKHHEAIGSFEKVLQIIPTHLSAQHALLELSVADQDWRAVQVAEERLLASMADPLQRFERLVEFGDRWMYVAMDIGKARAAFEKARDITGDDLSLLRKLRVVYEASRSEQEAYATRREIARLTPEPRARATQYFELAQSYRSEKKRDDVALVLLDLALDSDPSMLEPLEIVATLLAERQEWGELEKAYRKMLERAPRIEDPAVRREVTWELCRRLGLLFRDHFEDPRLALDAFEDALEEKPNDLGGRLIAADLSKGLGENEKAITHLQLAARLDPKRLETFHDLFELFQRRKHPDLAFCAASITMYRGAAESRERFIFEEHRAPSVPKLRRQFRPEAWDLLLGHNRDRLVEAILIAVAPAALSARAARLAAEGRLPALDPASRQDPEKSTASITRSFAWASHFLSVPAPAIYVRDEPPGGITPVLGEEPAVFVGSGVLRGRSLPELAFLVGRHLSYYAAAHQLLLYYPTMEDLSACFIAAVTIALPSVPVPSALKVAATTLRSSIEANLDADSLWALTSAVEAFDAAGGRASLRGWARGVERCATRAGAVLCGDVSVAASILEAEPKMFLAGEDKIADLLGFWVSNEHHAVRAELGIDIEP